MDVGIGPYRSQCTTLAEEKRREATPPNGIPIPLCVHQGKPQRNSTAYQRNPRHPRLFRYSGLGKDAENVLLNLAQISLSALDLLNFLFELFEEDGFLQPIPDDEP